MTTFTTEDREEAQKALKEPEVEYIPFFGLYKLEEEKPSETPLSY